VLDLQDTTLLASVRELPAGYERISRLRMRQHSPEVTRLVLELAGPVTMLPLQEAGPGRYVIPLFQGTAQEAQRMFDLDDFEPVISPDFSDDTKPVFGPQRGRGWRMDLKRSDRGHRSWPWRFRSGYNRLPRFLREGH